MYEENKLKKPLLTKITLLAESNERLLRILEENPDIDDYELEETNDEFLELGKRCCSLMEEIDELLVDTKYFPLCGLSSEEIKSVPEGPTFLPKVLKISTGEIKSVLAGEEAIEKHLTLELMNLKDEMKKRVGRLKTLKLDFKIDRRKRCLYKQIARCFTYGMFESCCILCRTIAESFAKEYIVNKGCGEDLDRKHMSVVETLRKLNVSKNVIKLYSEISKKANVILHDRNGFALEEDALSSINALHSFIKKCPKEA